jgi:regulator of replication initiation timing
MTDTRTATREQLLRRIEKHVRENSALRKQNKELRGALEEACNLAETWVEMHTRHSTRDEVWTARDDLKDFREVLTYSVSRGQLR